MISSMMSARMTSPMPARCGDVRCSDLNADLALAQQLGERGNDDGAGDRTGQAAPPADDQHGHDQEGEIEVKIFDPYDAEEMRE